MTIINKSLDNKTDILVVEAEDSQKALWIAKNGPFIWVHNMERTWGSGWWRYNCWVETI